MRTNSIRAGFVPCTPKSDTSSDSYLRVRSVKKSMFARGGSVPRNAGWDGNWRKTALAFLVIIATIWMPSTRADDKSDAAQPVAAKSGKKLSGRLPAHYGKVVDDRQRQEIYRIQEEYRPKIAKARDALNALVEEQKAKITAVLTPEQQRQIAEASGKTKKDVTTKRKKATDGDTATPAASEDAASEQ